MEGTRQEGHQEEEIILVPCSETDPHRLMQFTNAFFMLR
jgi:hypothetical protein